jgi:hypothetical protein
LARAVWKTRSSAERIALDAQPVVGKPVTGDRKRRFHPMKKVSAASKTTGRSKAERQRAIQATVECLDAMQPRTPKVAKLVALLRSWLTDESGNDEQTWPKLKKALDKERDRVGARRLFDG